MMMITQGYHSEEDGLNSDYNDSTIDCHLVSCNKDNDPHISTAMKFIILFWAVVLQVVLMNIISSWAIILSVMTMRMIIILEVSNLVDCYCFSHCTIFIICLVFSYITKHFMESHGMLSHHLYLFIM